MNPEPFPLDILILWHDKHLGLGAERAIYQYLSQHSAVRSLGITDYDSGPDFSAEVLQYLAEGRINTILVKTHDSDFRFKPVDALLRLVHSTHPDVVVVLLRRDGDDAFERAFPHYEGYFSFSYGGERIWSPDARWPTYTIREDVLDSILSQCQVWHLTRFEYDVAISYASEDRTFAEGLADHLGLMGLRVFYDGFEQQALFGKDLYTLFYDVYSRRSRYCVLVVSSGYASKMWTSHERRAAQERALRERQHEYILPVRLDDTTLLGLPTTLGFMRIDQGVEAIAEAVASKVRIKQPQLTKKYIGKSLY
jgi:hypothetical protein